MSKRQQELFAKSLEKHATMLHDELTAIGYKLLTPQESVQAVFDDNLHRPDRADAGNVIQKQYQYISSRGYTVIIHTGILDDTITKPMKWVMILGKKTKEGVQPKLFVKRFRKDHPIGLIPKLIAHGYLAKAIVDAKPVGAELVPVVNGHEWVYSDGNRKPFFITAYFKNIPKDYVKIICSKEYYDKKYLRKTQPLVDVGLMRRLPDIRKTWK